MMVGWAASKVQHGHFDAFVRGWSFIYQQGGAYLSKAEDSFGSICPAPPADDFSCHQSKLLCGLQKLGLRQ